MKKNSITIFWEKQKLDEKTKNSYCPTHLMVDCISSLFPKHTF